MVGYKIHSNPASKNYTHIPGNRIPGSFAFYGYFNSIQIVCLFYKKQALQNHQFPKIKSAAFSPIIIQAAFVLPEIISGMIDASAIRKFSIQ